MSIIYILVDCCEPKPRATPSYRHSRIDLQEQYVNAYSWEWRAVRAHDGRCKYIDCILIILQIFYLSDYETVSDELKNI